MKYKVGDSLLCKSDIYWANGKRIFTKDKHYTIKRFHRNTFNGNGEMEVHFECDIVYNDDGTEHVKFGRMTQFPWTDKNLDPNINYYIRNCFHHFYTKMQMRKLKLDKINEKSN